MWEYLKTWVGIFQVGIFRGGGNFPGGSLMSENFPGGSFLDTNFQIAKVQSQGVPCFLLNFLPISA